MRTRPITSTHRKRSPSSRPMIISTEIAVCAIEDHDTQEGRCLVLRPGQPGRRIGAFKCGRCSAVLVRPARLHLHGLLPEDHSTRFLDACKRLMHAAISARVTWTLCRHVGQVLGTATRRSGPACKLGDVAGSRHSEAILPIPAQRGATWPSNALPGTWPATRFCFPDYGGMRSAAWGAAPARPAAGIPTARPAG